MRLYCSVCSDIDNFVTGDEFCKYIGRDIQQIKENAVFCCTCCNTYYDKEYVLERGITKEMIDDALFISKQKRTK